MKAGNRTPVVLALAAACALSLVGATSASADTVVSNLRAEADGNALDPGTGYSNDSIRATADADRCDGSGDRLRLSGPNAMGIVGHAARVNDRLDPFTVSDQFEFGLIVCRIGDYGGFDIDDPNWVYKVNHEEAQVGGDQFELERGDEVLWYFADFAGGASGENTGPELDLKAPDRARPGEAFEVKVLSYDPSGDKEPAGPGVQVTGGVAPVATGADGTATVVAREDDTTVRGTRGTAVPTPPVEVCVDADIDRCPPQRGDRIYGTNDDDEIKGTGGADRISARGGDDRVDVEGRGADRVNCGSGQDKVVADGDDEVDKDCERVVR